MVSTKKLNKKRLTFIYFCLIAAFFFITFRLVFVVISGDKVTINKFYNNKKINKRADILDRNGIIIATDLRTKSLYIDNILIKNPQLTARKLSKLFPDLSYKDVLQKILSKKDHGWILIKRNVTPRQQKAIYNFKMAGLLFEDDMIRIYPQKSILSHIVGYVDLDRNGLSGIEKEYNDILSKGQDNLLIAMDIRVQDVLNNELSKGIKKYKAQAASGIIMDVNNGEILALSSLPNFDPNHQSSAKDNQRFNRATYGVYELGSIFKIFTNSIAFENNLVKIDDIYDVSKPIKYGKFTITDDHHTKDKLTVEEIFIYSSNIGTVKIAEKIGVSKQKKSFKKFGLLNRLKADLPELGRPIYPKKWRKINSFTIAYGHGIAVTPLHIATVTAAIVNGGIFYQPSFAKLSQKPIGNRIIKKSTSKIMNQLMRKTVTKGTGRNANAKGYRVGGKTGTAEKAEQGSYNTKETFASFIAAFPMPNPKYLIFVTFDHPNYRFNTGGMVAAPVVNNIIKNIAPILGVTPINSN